MVQRPPENSLHGLTSEVRALRDRLIRIESQYAKELETIPPRGKASARNLLHYIAFRKLDLRRLQQRLFSLGISSLGHSEAHVLGSVETVLALLQRLERTTPGPWPAPRTDAITESRQRQSQLSNRLLGKPTGGRTVRVMVTAPLEAATDPMLVRRMLENGMNCLRINCAHDSEEIWRKIAENLRTAQKETGLSCKVLMDLGGPKLRTGKMISGPKVKSWKPRRDRLGRIMAPARVMLVPTEASSKMAKEKRTWLAVEGLMESDLQVGDVLHFRDARRKLRQLEAIRRENNAWVTECWSTTYIVPKTQLKRKNVEQVLEVADFPALEDAIVLRGGDLLILDNQLALPGTPAVTDEKGKVREPARVACTLPEIFRTVRTGQPIWFDDGKIAGVVAEAHPDHLVVQIRKARDTGTLLRSDRAINLPDTEIDLPTLSEKDQADLKVAVEIADLVGLSFVRFAADVENLLSAMRSMKAEHLGVILKIETKQAVENLADLLMTALHHETIGVMIARGDLAIECGYQRLAELQEEILWFCEASHIPVIWATQVLESLTKKGRPSRAEVTDAAMSERAECVMLNKGPFILEAMQFLNDILIRMRGHQRKKMVRLRPLRMAKLGMPARSRTGDSRLVAAS